MADIWTNFLACSELKKRTSWAQSRHTCAVIERTTLSCSNHKKKKDCCVTPRVHHFRTNRYLCVFMTLALELCECNRCSFSLLFYVADSIWKSVMQEWTSFHQCSPLVVCSLFSELVFFILFIHKDPFQYNLFQMAMQRYKNKFICVKLYSISLF